jgi:hypothetical protein
VALGCVDFFPVSGSATATVIEATVTKWTAPGDIRVVSMTCGLAAAPGGTAVRTITLMQGGVGSATVTCQIAAAETTCAVTPASPEPVPSGTQLYLRDAVSGGLIAAASHVSCTIYYTVDGL